MRILKLNLLAVALLLFGATSASAFAVNQSVRGGVLPTYAASDIVIVDVFLDADPGLTLLSIGVLYPDDGTVIYDGVAAFMLAPIALSGTSGALESYILYTAPMTMTPSTILYPNVDNVGQGYPGANFWNMWAGINQPGKLQVNLDYFENAFGSAAASGTGIYIGTLVFHLAPGFAGATIDLCVTCGGNTVNQGGSEEAGNTLLGAQIVLNAVPEPTTALLIGLGVLGLATAGRRRA